VNKISACTAGTQGLNFSIENFYIPTQLSNDHC